MFSNRSMATGMVALSVVALAGAQATGINGDKVHPYVFADFAASGFTSSGTFPTIIFDDPHVNTAGQGTGSGSFANRHVWRSSNDHGATDYLTTGPNDFFNFTFGLNLTAVDTASRKEAGFLITTGDNTHQDCQFILTSNSGTAGGNSGGAGEVAAFGGAFPFFRFTGTGGLTGAYTEGTTATMGVKYYQVASDTGHTYHMQFMYNGFTSPDARLGGGFDVTGLPANTLLGAYMQVPKDANNPANNNGGHAVWNNVAIVPVPEPMTMLVLGAGALAVIRRRRKNS